MKQPGAYSVLREQGELVEFQYATGHETEPESMEETSFANGPKRKKHKKKHTAKKTTHKASAPKVSTSHSHTTTTVDKVVNSPVVKPKKTAKGMSNNMKIGIAVGALVVIGGLVWYFKSKKKK